MPASIPKTVKVGTFTYRIEVSQAAIDAATVRNSKHLMGCCSSELLLIAIAPDLAHDQLADTLLHEVLHACCQVSGADLDSRDGDDHEEHAVGAISPHLLGALRDNPKLVEFLVGD